MTFNLDTCNSLVTGLIISAFTVDRQCSNQKDAFKNKSGPGGGVWPTPPPPEEPPSPATAPGSASLARHSPLLLTTPTWHLPNPSPPGPSSPWGDTHIHIPYQKRRLLLRLPAPVKTPGSWAAARRRRRVPDTQSRRGARARSPESPRSRRRHQRRGRSLALLHFRPPGSSEFNPQRRAALEAHRKSSHPRRPEMTSRDPTWPALRPPSLAQPRKETRAALEHAQTELSL
ncbi:programmed cell death protein 7-like [Equus przewalskii]|uniref:Programmed cell death protein 7-like n=1 Tax=Equus przewalskii TaxID=9798 RepID=A0ABM4QGI7_EQUPR